MGCTSSRNGGGAAEAQANASIQKAQAQAKRDLESRISLFLVGSGDSGKSTLMKQLANLNTSKFESPESRKQHFKSVVITNLYDGAFQLIEAFPNELASASEIELLQTHYKTGSIPPQVAEIFVRIFKEGRDSEDLQDCFRVFSAEFCKNPTWGEPEWIPSVDDCIRARIRTTGVVKEEFVIQGVQFEIVDVGGQKAERRKWMHKFEEVKALIFVAALSEYDMGMFEDKKTNRLEDSLDLFEQISHSEFMKNKPVLLYLNKKDLFEEKIGRVPLSASGLEGAPSEVVSSEAAIEWIVKEYKKRRQGTKGAEVYVHVTCAIDPNNVKAVFEASKKVMFRQKMDEMGL